MTAGLNAWASIIDKALGGDLDDGAANRADLGDSRLDRPGARALGA